ncbi:MAG: hypothetical protein F6K31_42355 [Symploca sp. SIO2G7]|nr:hypothetical protein [Symploca sp. SIO2G7]
MAQTNTKFKCIWCDFHRDLNVKTKKSNSNFLLPVIVFLALISSVGAIRPNPQPKPPVTPDSSSPSETTITSTVYPRAACGYDMGQVENGVDIIELHPIFVDYSPAILEIIQTEYCRDAFRNNQNGLIQVASFRDRDKANEFQRFIKTIFGNAQVGAVRPVEIR